MHREGVGRLSELDVVFFCMIIRRPLVNRRQTMEAPLEENYVCMHVSMHVRMYACMYVCM